MPRLGKSISSFSKKEVTTFFETSKVKARIPGLRVLISPAQKELGRILIITPRRSGNSCQRHLIRRRFKAIFLQEQLYKKGFDCGIIVRSEGIDTSFEDLRKLLLCAFQASVRS